MKNLYLTLVAILMLAVTASGQITSTTGSFIVCVGETTALTDTFGGSWSVYPTSIATITSTGSVTGVAAGTATVSYVGPGGSSSTAIMTVNPAPTPITGLSSVCQGSTISLSSSPGGTWVSDPIAVAMVGSSSGIVTGITPGTSTITYHTPAGCIPTMVVTVNPLPLPFTGSSALCQSLSTTLMAGGVGGTWSSSDPAIVTHDAFIYAVGGSPGTATLTYTLPTGCYRTIAVTVNPAPAPITGTTEFCVGSTTTLACASPGGTWSSPAPPIIVGSATGIVSSSAPAAYAIHYTLSTGCYAAAYVSVSALPGPITGPSIICVGTTATFSTPVAGTWSSSNPSVASTPGYPSTVTGISAGTATITCSTSAVCYSTYPVTVSASPAAITGTASLCVGGTTTLSATGGGTWGSSSSIIIVGATTGVVSATAAGTATITYALSTGCVSTIVITAYATPTVGVSTFTPVSCSPLYKIVADGATTYSWAPSGTTPGVTADTAYLCPDGTTYTVTGTTSGCSGTTTVTATVPNRILGHLSFGGPAPSGTSAKVWLIQFNPTDSSITAQDSMLTCLDGGNPYYQFDSKPAGSYLVKAKLTSSVAGTTDYLPTYGASSATWDVATPITHTSTSDSLHIAMLYGTVPSGPGFISGYVYMGAGKGTSGEVPAAHMIVYLKNATGTVLTFTYTDGSGAYSFSSLAYGSYVVYPEEMSYYTIPSSVITLSAATPSAGPIGFKKRTTVGTIEPWTLPDAVTMIANAAAELYPNPANDIVVITNASGKHVTITDVTGREMYSTVAIQTLQTINIANLPNAVYMVVATGNGQIQRFRLVKE